MLSPESVDFVAEVEGFALSADEVGEAPAAVEARHIAAIRSSDFVWLHAPDGYVGPSGALEVGVAHSFGIPVWSTTAPADITIREFVQTAVSPEKAVREAAVAGARAPAGPLKDLQRYYGRVAVERGFDRETPQDTMLLLTEEVGELARAVRKAVGLVRAGGDRADAAEELADVQLYLLHLANVIGVDLASAVIDKELINHERYGRVAA